MKIRLIFVNHKVETITDYPTTEKLRERTLSHIGQALDKATRAYCIKDNGWECTVIKEGA